LSRIASGTLGDVFLARRATATSDSGSGDADFAVKLIRPELARDLRFLRLLFTEAPAAVRFSHRASARVLAVERDAADVYIATELAHGQPLSQLLKRAQLAGEALEHRLICFILAEVASVLAAAHAMPWFAGAPAGMVHGGVSPRSVLITYQGEVKVLGAGAGRARLSLPISSARLPYAAPEVLQDKEPTPRIDTYALGIVAHEALTGKNAFRRATDDETKQAIREARVPSINPLSLKVKPEIAELVMAMVLPKPEARHADLTALEAQFREAAGGPNEVLASALETRMRGLFSGEIRAERRVVAAAHRQSSSVSGTPATSNEITLAEGGDDPTPELQALDQSEATLREHSPESRVIEMPVAQAIAASKASAPAQSRDAGGIDPPPNQGRHSELSVDVDDAPAITSDEYRVPDGTTIDFSGQRRIARYQTESLLKRTATSAVFRARDPNVARTVLLRVMSPDFINDSRLRREEWITLFKREARVAGRLSHPLLPTLFDAGRDGAFFFIVYSMIEGEPLSHVLDRGETIPTDRIVRIISDVALALAHLHAHGVVHCDVRASNVVIDIEGRAHLVDFSLASDASGPDHPLLASNSFVHSPEYLKGFGYGPASDQFALGALLYQLLAGVRPFRAIDDRELVRAILELAPRSPIELDPRIDGRLSEIAVHMLEKEPNRRYENCAEVATELLRQEGSVLDASTDRMSRLDILPEVPRSDSPSFTPDIVLIDEALDPTLAKTALRNLKQRVAVYADLERAMKVVENYAPPTVILAESPDHDRRLVRRRVEQISRDIELRFVPDLAHRLLGSFLDANRLADALISTLERTGSLAAPVDPEQHGGATQAARVLAAKLKAGPRAEIFAPLAVAARELAGRMRLSPTAEEILALVPPEMGPLFTEIERVFTDPEEEGGPSATLLAQIVAVVEAYFSATRPVDGSPRASPRKAIAELRAHSGKRVEAQVVDVLIEHLREVVSALDISPHPDNPPRIVLAGDLGHRDLVRGLEEDGFFVEEVASGQAAFDALRKDGYAGAIIDRAVPGRDALSVLRMVRSHPDTREAPVLILCVGSDPLLEAEVARAGRAEILERSAATEVVRARVGRLMR
jgi:serine/threonine-protein kinase